MGVVVGSVVAMGVGCGVDEPERDVPVVDAVSIRSHVCMSSTEPLNEDGNLDVTLTGQVVEATGEAFRPFKCDVDNAPSTKLAVDDGAGGRVVLAFDIAVDDVPVALNLPELGTEATVHLFALEEEEFFPARGVTVSDDDGLRLAYDDLGGLGPRAGGSFPELAGLVVEQGENEGQPIDVGLCGTASRAQVDFHAGDQTVVVSNEAPSALTLAGSAFTAHNLDTQSLVQTDCDDFFVPTAWLLVRDVAP
jgi:hypothetical protein